MLAFCLCLGGQAQKFTEMETALQMYITDSLYLYTLESLGGFIETKDTSYFHRAKEAYTRLGREAKFLKENGQPAEAWSRVYRTNVSLRPVFMDGLDRFYFGDEKFVKEIAHDKDTSASFVGIFTRAAQVQSADILGAMIKCSSVRKSDYDYLVKQLDDAQMFLRYSMAILEKYLKKEQP